MAVIPDAVEIWDYVPPNPSNAVVIADRYIIIVDQTLDEFMVFDAFTETSRAFNGVGTMSGVGASRTVVALGSYAWTVGGSDIVRIGTNGGVTTKAFVGSFIGTKDATVAADSGNVWVGFRAASTTRFVGFIDPSTFNITTVTGFATGSSGHRIISAGGVTYQSGTKRWNSATGAALADGPSVPIQTARNPTVDGNTMWYTAAGDLYKVDLTTGSFTTVTLGVGGASGFPDYGPNNLVYVNEILSPNTKLRVVDRANSTRGDWEYPIARTARYTTAYAQGKMWAFAGETP